MKTNKTAERINEAKCWFFRKDKYIEKPLARLTQTNKIRDEKEILQPMPKKAKKIIREYFEKNTIQ
jgi:hypothetical protein